MVSVTFNFRLHYLNVQINMHGVGYWPAGYHLRLVCLPKGRKATKKCVEQDRKAVLVPYSKATFWKISKAMCDVRTERTERFRFARNYKV